MSPPPRNETLGFALGFLGVACFGLTLPATIFALDFFGPGFIGLGRAAVAGLVAGSILLLTRQPLPRRNDLLPLVLVSLGVVFGFPLLSSWAMQHLPAAHGSILLGVLPLATAVAGAAVAGDRPSLGFWLVGIAASGSVVVYALLRGAGGLHPADLALLAAVAAAAIGYAAGGRLARSLGAWQTICWALVISLPPLLPLAGWSLLLQGDGWPSAGAMIGFLYVALVAQLFGFFAWYRGLAIGGVARVSQVQLLQPFVTLAAAALLLGEVIDLLTLGFALLVVILVAVGRRMPIARRDLASPR